MEISGSLLKHVPNHDYNFAIKAVSNNPKALKYTTFRTSEICLLAVSKLGTMLKYIAPEYQTFEIKRAAIDQTCSSVQYIDTCDDIVQHCLDKYGDRSTDYADIKNILNCFSSLVIFTYFTARYYHDRGMLLKFAEYGVQFMYWPHSIDDNIANVLVRGNYNNILIIPNEHRTFEMYKYVFSKNLSFILQNDIEKIPTNEYELLLEHLIESYPDEINYFYKYIKNPTKEMMKRVVTIDPNFFDKVDMDYELWEIVLKKNGMKLEFCKNQDYNLATIAVTNYESALEYVEKHILDLKLYAIALKCNHSMMHLVNNLSSEDYNYLIDVHNARLSLQYIDPSVQTEELCIKIVRLYPNQYIHVSNLTQNIVNTILDVNIHMMGSFDEKYITEDHKKKYIRAFPQNILALQNILGNLITRDILIFGLSKNGMSIGYVKDEDLDYELCVTAVKNNGGAIRLIKDRFITKELCFEAIKNTLSSIQYVPKDYIDDEIVEFLLENNPYMIKYIDPSNVNYYKFVKYAVKLDYTVVKLIHKDFITDEIAYEVINKDGGMLQYFDNQNYKLCLESIKSKIYKYSDKHQIPLHLHALNKKRLINIKDKCIKNECLEYMVSEYIKTIDNL